MAGSECRTAFLSLRRAGARCLQHLPAFLRSEASLERNRASLHRQSSRCRVPLLKEPDLWVCPSGYKHLAPLERKRIQLSHFELEFTIGTDG